MADDRFKEVFHAVEDFRAAQCRACKTEEELIMIAVQFVHQAVLIYTEIGGAKLAAKQLYHVADTEAGKVKADG